MKKLIIILVILSSVSFSTLAQTGQLKGFILDASNGRAIPSATVLIKGTHKGIASDENGYYLLSRLPAGSLTVIVQSIGYESREIPIVIQNKQMTQLVVQLKPAIIELGEATISATRQRWKSTNTVSMHQLTSSSIERIPSMSGKPDLAEYLQVIPGIIFTGDQGGQFYVRGGAPVHNLVKLDGLTVISPFHSIGFVSVFDTETIALANIYTAGFGAEYGGRLSSVIDLKTRTGNRRQTAGTLNISNFGYGLTMDVPIVKMTEKNPRSLSVLFSNKGSYIDKIANNIYPYLDDNGIPYRYNDLYTKVSFMDVYGDQVDIQAMHIDDNAWFGEAMQSHWVNNAGGARYLTSPSSSQWLYEASCYMSDYRGEFIENNERPRKTFYNSLENNMRVFRRGEIAEWDIGLSLDFYNTIHSFQGIEGVTLEHEFFTTEVVTYLANKTHLGKWLIEPGLRLVYYADQTFFSPEPRLKIKYMLSQAISINLAAGWYTQNLMSVTSDRDVRALFQGYYIGPHLVQDYFKGKLYINKIQQAWHGVLGASLLTHNDIKFTVEGYIKDFVKLVSYNRNKIYRESALTWNLPEYLKSYFLLEKGYAYGVDFLMDYAKNDFSLWMGYSLAFVFREDEMMSYIPHYDRRHNLNVLAGYQFGQGKSWKLKVRWNLGSGFPFTQTNGIFEEFTTLYDSFRMDVSHNGSLNAWYADLNQGRLPWYHRLDISLNKKWEFSSRQKLELAMGVINAYNRRNMFYIDRLTSERIDQFPILPNISVKYSF
ncbi:MAG: carboxypeptidase-like regulatory domain-containing protein [Bacteroidales bacterium]|nr:carboxypeptidase-like regulatory domain-containing protein [Bacteroidales bacterium]